MRMIYHFKGFSIFIVILLVTLITSCNQERKYEKNIVRETFSWNIYSDSSLVLQYPSTSEIEREYSADMASSDWFNIKYPKWGVTLYCTYIRISEDRLLEAFEDTHKLVYRHTAKASAINELKVTADTGLSGGIIFDIRGEVATPLQFFMTDSTNHFFRGSMYYDHKVKSDSVKFITDFVRDDIIHMLETIKWKSLN